MDDRTIQTLVYMVAVGALFYFLFVMPQRRQRKRTMEMLAALAPGDRVTTAGGIRGTVVAVSDDEVEVRIADGVVVSVDRTAIVARHVDESADA